MSEFLLALLLGQQGASTECACIDEELASLRTAERDEQALLASKDAGSGFGVAVRLKR